VSLFLVAHPKPISQCEVVTNLIFGIKENVGFSLPLDYREPAVLETVRD
jgi:hypothetical protein